jgi:hypothetical protein
VVFFPTNKQVSRLRRSTGANSAAEPTHDEHTKFIKTCDRGGGGPTILSAQTCGTWDTNARSGRQGADIGKLLAHFDIDINVY